MKREMQYQIEHQYKTWQRDLDSFRQENALLKYRLSEMVDINEGSNFLQMAEYFQNELLVTDDNLKKLFNSFEKLSDQFQKSNIENKLTMQAMKDYNKLKNEIIQFENRFIKLKKEFNEKMLENSRH